MKSNRRVLVVAPHADVAETVVGWLTSQGHETRLVTDFVSAKPELDAHPPDLLVTEIKLGAFNGLHLAIRAHSQCTRTSTIVIGDADNALEREAFEQHASYVRQPQLATMFADTARAVLG